MRVRFEDQLQIETHADPRAIGALVPNMILQTLVENAIKHGVEPRGEEGHVEVGATLEGDTLVLTVRDDGPGMPPWSPAPSDELPGSARGGVGLRNTAARLAQLYGETHRFTVGPAPGGGILAEIRLPYRTRGTVPDRGTTRGR
jgi:sensor histidine kinase YesM